MIQKHQYKGLTDAEVIKSRRENGTNILTPPKKIPLWKQFLSKFSDPLIIILLIAGFLSIGIACYEYIGLDKTWEVYFEPVGIFIAIFLATGIAFIFEVKAGRQFAILNQVNDDEPIEVIRNGNATMVPKKDIVVGDIVLLTTGDEIPADGTLLEAVSLNVDESSLTGEPICHKSTRKEDADKDATYATDRVLRGTKVMEGHGIFRVDSVGDNTENGKVFEAAQIDDSVKTPLNEQLDGLAALVTKVSYVIAAMIIVGRLVVYFDWTPSALTLAIPTAIFFYLVIKEFGKWKWQAVAASIIAYFVLLMAMVVFIFHTHSANKELADLITYTLDTLMIAVTLIVVAVPEGLPMAVTLSLAYSMQRMLRTNNLVRKMHACETMGATTVICTDKTGTLTQNQMQVYETDFFGLRNQALTDDEESRLIEEGIAVNSTASLDHSNPDTPSVLGNPTEGALILWLNARGKDYRDLRANATTIEELPFSTERKYMATVVNSALLPGKRILYVKGAPEIILSLCKNVKGGVSRDDIMERLHDYQDQAMRTLGFACQILNDGDKAIEDGKSARTCRQPFGNA